jgi:hypothetical protein
MYVNALWPAWAAAPERSGCALAAPQREELRRRRQERKRNAGLAKTVPRPDDRQLATPKGDEGFADGRQVRSPERPARNGAFNRHREWSAGIGTVGARVAGVW